MNPVIQSQENAHHHEKAPGEAKVLVKDTRNRSLDVIRALAIFLVIFNHLKPYAVDNSNQFYKLLRYFFYLISTGGWVGVDLFFVLSGFLVSGLLFKEYHQKNSIDATRFLIRRGFKIYPSFFLFIGVTFLLEKFFFNGFNFPGIDYLKDALFVHNYFGGRWDHTWSLDVEELFYFLLTGIFLIYIKFKGLNLRVLVTTYVVLLVIAIAARYAANVNHPEFSFDLHFSKTHFRLDSLFFGVVLSYLYNTKKEQLTQFVNKYRWFLVVPAVIFLLPNFFLAYWKYHIISVLFLSTNAICFGALLMVALSSKWSFFNNRFLSYIGMHSYCIYLWHVPINVYLVAMFNSLGIAVPFENKLYWLLYMVCYVSSSLLVGILFTEIVEKPFIKLRDKAYPAKSVAAYK